MSLNWVSWRHKIQEYKMPKNPNLTFLLWAKCHYSWCRFNECHVFIVMLSVLIINVVKLTVMFLLLCWVFLLLMSLNWLSCLMIYWASLFLILWHCVLCYCYAECHVFIVMLSAIIMYVVILNVIMLNVVAPQNNPRQNANNPNPTKHVRSDNALSETVRKPRLRLDIETQSSKNLSDLTNGTARFSDLHRGRHREGIKIHVPIFKFWCYYLNFVIRESFTHN
jgi:hypothetical protein